MPEGDCLCKPPVLVARKLERAPTTPMTNWKNKLLAFLHDPPSKALDTATDVERFDAAANFFPAC